MAALIILGAVAALVLALHLVNRLSYSLLKKRVLRRRKWGLNICCGETDGGGVNADIFKHADLPSFVQVDIYDLPFEDKQFHTVLCSHTMEHVEDPDRFYRELKRVGKNVTIVVPPLWDLFGTLNMRQHRWLFLTMRKEHDTLPSRVRLPLSRFVQKHFGQKVTA